MNDDLARSRLDSKAANARTDCTLRGLERLHEYEVLPLDLRAEAGTASPWGTGRSWSDDASTAPSASLGGLPEDRAMPLPY